jgi:hypothetical protein
VGRVTVARVKTLRWCFILFQCVWLNAVLPGHTRGVVTLPGTGGDARASVETHACCAGAAKMPEKKNDAPARKPATGDCAICFFAAHMATPPPAIDPPAPLGLREILPVHAPAPARSLDHRFAYLGRGPPLA